MTELTGHARSPLYLAAADCDHEEPPEPETGRDDDDWDAWHAWSDDHPSGDLGEDGDGLICLLTPSGWYCPACTAVARTERDLPDWEHIECVTGVGDE